ncbi:unnamed protein product [Leptosia nina]|uniref:Uncharacterized protein n=1 Tax=Leptosia nina TaxID=320188 RepID=A0AAV1JJL2_9NEOP
MEDVNKKKRNVVSADRFSISGEKLAYYNLSYRNFSGVQDCIKLSTQLCELNLSHNNLRYVPQSVMDMCNIRILDLSFNNIEVFDDPPRFYNVIETLDISNNNLKFPPRWVWKESPERLIKVNMRMNVDQIVNMENLKVLSLDSNDLCMLPDNLVKLHNLKKIDLYDNFLSDIPGIEQFDEIDLAQNHHDEPDSVTYLTKRNKLRLTTVERCCGRKAEVIQDDYEFTSDEESLFNEELEDRDLECGHRERSDSSSSEDWDSDDWWIPTSEPSRVVFRSEVKRLAEPWLIFTHEKIAAGNFCPCDLHVLPISDRINHKQTGNSQVPQRSDDLDQFDDDYDDDNY